MAEDSLVVGQDHAVHFTACDADDLPVSNARLFTASINPDAPKRAVSHYGGGTYVVAVQVELLGTYALNVALGGTVVSAKPFMLATSCPKSGRTVELSDGRCGCGQGLYLDNNGECSICTAPLSSTEGSDSCNVCGEGFFLSSKAVDANAQTCKACPKG